MSANFENIRRQPYISKTAFDGTMQHFVEGREILAEKLAENEGKPAARSRILRVIADQKWDDFQLRFTAGQSVEELRALLGDVVRAYEQYAEALDVLPDDEYHPPFILNDVVDRYVDYLNLICTAILLHREDLIPTIHGLNAGTDYDGEDAIIEELLSFYLPDRPKLNEWFWEKPYNLLLDVIDVDDSAERPKAMKKYVKAWYPAMKGRAMFFGKHENIEEDFSPYFGYWAMCAAAVTYLYDIDDSSYRDELVYPKDLVEYARSTPRKPVVLDEGNQLLRVLGGQPCPKEGTWFSPAKMDSARRFKAGEIMPSFDASEYGATIWQWVAEHDGS